MPTPKLQVSRALNVYASDNALTPCPVNLKVQQTNTSTGASQLIASAGLFVTRGVQVGDVVWNTATNTYATVIAVNSETTLTLNANIFTASSVFFQIFGSPYNNAGCVLYIGTTGNLTVLTAGDDIVTFTAVPAGIFLPVNVKQIYTSTTASNIVALW
jgi:hypothetical protein